MYIHNMTIFHTALLLEKKLGDFMIDYSTLTIEKILAKGHLLFHFSYHVYVCMYVTAYVTYVAMVTVVIVSGKYGTHSTYAYSYIGT